MEKETRRESRMETTKGKIRTTQCKKRMSVRRKGRAQSSKSQPQTVTTDGKMSKLNTAMDTLQELFGDKNLKMKKSELKNLLQKELVDDMNIWDSEMKDKILGELDKNPDDSVGFTDFVSFAAQLYVCSCPYFADQTD